MNFKLKENKKDITQSEIEVSGIVRRHKVETYLEDFTNLEKREKELEAKISYEEKVQKNIILNYPEVLKLSEKIQQAAFLLVDSKSKIDPAKKQLKEIKDIIKSFNKDVKEIKEQTNLDIKSLYEERRNKTN